MRSRIFIFCFSALMCACGSQGGGTKSSPIPKNNSNKKFFSQDGKFRIQFEAVPTAYSQYIPYEGGKIMMNYFMHEKGINLIYCITYADYPANFTEGKNAEDILAGLLQTYIDTQKAGLEKEKMISVGPYPGIYFKANNSDTFVYGEYILRENRLYQLTVTKEGDYHNEGEVNRFFQSLEFL